MGAVAASAGRNASSCSSATVTSSAVANVVIVVVSRSSPRAERSRTGTAKPTWSGPRRYVRHVAGQLVVEVATRDAVEDVLRPLRQVDDPRRQALRVQGEAQHVDR